MNQTIQENNQQTFQVKDCALILRMGGVPAAANLRELRERIAVCPKECLFHHFCETFIRPSFVDPEFRNDFAVWSAYLLRDMNLAEQLAVVDPYKFSDMEGLRERVLDIVDERLSEVAYVPWVPKGSEFRFMRAATVIFETGTFLDHPEDLASCLPKMSHSSIYYHFIEARRRTPDRLDDFSAWMSGLDPKPSILVNALSAVPFYFLNLRELKKILIQTVEENLAGVTS